MGRAVVVWKDGKVVTIPPSEIPTQSEEPTNQAAYSTTGSAANLLFQIAIHNARFNKQDKRT
jgi:hypothetical protein